MNRLLSLLALGVATAAPASAAADVLDVASLPSGGPMHMPDAADMPSSIDADEHVDGIFVSEAPERAGRMTMPGVHRVRVFGDESLAKRHEQSGMRDIAGRRQTGACFTVANRWRMKEDLRFWPTQHQRFPMLRAGEEGTPAAEQFSGRRVRALRLERVAFDDDGARLSATEAFVDPLTGGAQLIENAELELVRVAETADVRVFAAQGSEGDTFHFLVHQKRPEGAAGGLVGRNISVRGGLRTGHSQCGHALVTLEAQPAGGETTTVSLDAVVSIDETEPAETSDEEGAEPSGIVGLLVGERNEKRPQVRRELRTRKLQVYLSASRTSGDDEPVVSVSFGWNGKERVRPIF